MHALSHSQQVVTAADVVEQAWCAAWSALRADPATWVEDAPTYLRVITPGSSDLLLNAVLRLRQPEPVTRADIEQVLAPFRALHQPCQWWLRPDTAPTGLRFHLSQIGMQPWSTVPGMVLALDTWQPRSSSAAPVTARAARNRAEAEAALTVICSVYNIVPGPMHRWCVDNPHFTMYIAWMGRDPAAALACQTVDGTIGFFHVATMPQWRRQGIAQTLMAQALTDAQAAGTHIAALTATPMAESLYRGLGFTPTAPIEMWMPGPAFMRQL